MKYFFFSLLIFASIIAKGQLYYLGDDEVQKGRIDGYLNSKRTMGMVMLDYAWYYPTPNGNFYQTGGTEKNTKIIKQFAPQNLPLLNATNRYVYLAYNMNGNDIKDLARYSPTTGFNLVTTPHSYNSFISINTIQVPLKQFLVDEIFTTYDKDAIGIRKFAENKFSIYIVKDSTDKAEADLIYSSPLNMDNITTPIDVSTEIEIFKNDVYWNGREKPTGVYETTINIFKQKVTNPRQYEFKTNFRLLTNKVFPYFRFLRTDKNIYGLFKKEDSTTGAYTHSLFLYKEKTIQRVKQNLIPQTTDFDTQKIDNDIYVSCKGYLLKFDEAKSKFITIIYDESATTGWDDVQKNTRFLKVKDYYLFRKSGKLWVFNAATEATKELAGEVLPKTLKSSIQYNTYAYATSNAFYFTQRVNDKEVFTKYNPVTETFTPIEFPAFKKQEFDEIKNIYYCNKAFVFLTSYKGKRDKPVYKMFMYYEELWNK